jgi:hypothetical protein
MNVHDRQIKNSSWPLILFFLKGMAISNLDCKSNQNFAQGVSFLCFVRNLCNNSQSFGSTTCQVLDKDLNRIYAAASVNSNVRRSLSNVIYHLPLTVIEETQHAAYSCARAASRKRTRRTHLHVFSLLVVLNYSTNCATLLEHYTLQNTPTLPTLVWSSSSTPSFRWRYALSEHKFSLTCLGNY